MSTRSPSRPSLLNRLRLKTSSLSLPGLRPPRRTLTEFYIRLDDPHRVYSPTDVVKGCVCITVERSLNLTHLVVSLVGRVDLNLSSGKDSGRKRKEWDDRYDDGTGGGVILCKEQIVLCGDREGGQPLQPGVYEFGFELMFVPVGKMEGGLPSSLDFEKGSISYTISSTLTRPTTISPTTTCTTKINMVETIDIAHLTPPKPRVISLEPIISRRSRKRPSSPATTPSITSSPNSSSSNLSPSSDPGIRHPSPAPNPALIKSKTITASIEMMKAGALRGDSIPVKISIRHTKPIKSLNGIILTLHRQSRFDPAHRAQPPLKKALSSAGGSGGGGTFRKDLAQTVMPLIVDPKTLTTVVRANLRVPEDVFPTITSVPGGEVSFRYYVEVVVDLGGKLSGREDLFAGSTIPGLPRPKTGGEGDGGGGMTSEGGIIVETERIRRREKSIVFCRFEVVIGSVDSVGGKGRRGGVRHVSIPQVPAEEANDVVDLQLAAPASPMIRHKEPERREYHGEQAPDYTRHPGHEALYHHHTPSPRLEQSGPMDEKARLRLAEQTLLPSAPPGLEPGESSSASASAPPLALEETPGYYPSAPPLDQEDGAEDKMETERRRLIAAASGPDEGGGSSSSGGIGPSAPVLDESELEGGLPRYRR